MLLHTAIRTELLKIRATRLTAGLLAAAVGLSAVIVLIEVSQAGSGGTGSTAIPALTTSAGLRDVLTNTGFAMLVAAVFGVTVSSGEFRHHTATDTYLDEPSRVRVLAAKVLAAAVGGMHFGLAASAVTTATGVIAAEANGHALPIGIATIAGYALGAILGAGLMAAIGAALGTLIRSQISALIIIFAWCMALESILAKLSEPLARFLPLLSATTIAGADSQASMPPVPTGLHALQPALVVALLAGYTAVLAVVAGVGTARRDIS